MKKIFIVKANGSKDIPTVPAIININGGPVPEFGPDPGWEKKSTAFFRSQAVAIADALESTLPGGTFSELLSELLRRRACHFTVKLGGEE